MTRAARLGLGLIIFVVLCVFPLACLLDSNTEPTDAGMLFGVLISTIGGFLIGVLVAAGREWE